jgi:erythromycin esterase-like protein
MPAIVALLMAARGAVATPAPSGARDASTGAPVERLVADACGKRLVLLGEDLHHGSGATVAAKADVARRLVERCGFSVVLFEGQVYDFLALDRAFRERRATPAMLSDTIGGLWSPTVEYQPFEDFLFARANEGRLFLGGIDPQLGGASQRYSQQHLAEDLFGALPEPARHRCVERLDTLANWRFADASPYDEAFRNGIRECLGGVGTVPATGPTRLMAMNLAAYLDMPGDGGRRDAVMADNVRWYLDRLPRDAKAIVWTASVHAATAAIPGGDGSAGREPMGADLRRAFGDSVAAIGIVATSGSYGSHGRAPFPLAPAAPSLLEAGKIDAPAAMAYLDHRRLAAAGRVPSRVLDYAHPRAQDWSSLFDGILVLRGEHPLRRLESPAAPLPARRQDSR